jgi:hypothetical protein
MSNSEISVKKIVELKIGSTKIEFDLLNEEHKEILKKLFESVKDDIKLPKEVQYVPYYPYYKTPYITDYKITCKHNGTSEWITYDKDNYICTAKGNSQ